MCVFGCARVYENVHIHTHIEREKEVCTKCGNLFYKILTVTISE